MGLKFEERSIDEIESTADALGKAASHLSSIVLSMQSKGLSSLILAWSQRQWTAIDLVVEMSKQAAMMADAQFLAHAQGRPSIYEKTMQRTARDTEKKKLRLTEPAVKKPRGRPRKGTT